MNNNIQEPYCSFEVSKLLKEKGFDIQGDKVYGQVFENTFRLVNISFTKMDEESGFKDAPYFNAPTHALAIEWIRVNFGIWVMVDCASTDFWFPKIIKTSDGSFAVHTVEITHPKGKSHPKGKFDTPQEATEAALLYTLQNLIP